MNTVTYNKYGGMSAKMFALNSLHYFSKLCGTVEFKGAWTVHVALCTKCILSKEM